MSDTSLALSLTDKLVAAREASRVLATVTTRQKNEALAAIARAVESNATRIIPANDLDLANGRENGLSEGLQDRLRLDEKRLAALATAVRDIIALPDPVGDGRSWFAPSQRRAARRKCACRSASSARSTRRARTSRSTSQRSRSRAATPSCCAAALPQRTPTACSSPSSRKHSSYRDCRSRSFKRSTSSGARAPSNSCRRAGWSTC